MPGISLGKIPGHSQDNFNTVPVAGGRPTSPMISHAGRIGILLYHGPGTYAVGADDPFGSVHPMQQSYSARDIVGSGLCDWAMQAEWNDVSNALRAGWPTLFGCRGRDSLDWLGKVYFDYSQNTCWPVRELRGRPRGRFNSARHSLFLPSIVCTLFPERRYALRWDQEILTMCLGK